MSETVSNGLLLLLVGMSTVIGVLAIVVLTGKVLIIGVGRYMTFRDGGYLGGRKDQYRDGMKIAAITAAIHAVSGGKAHITHIESID